MKKEYILLSIIFLFAVGVRFFSFWPDKTIIGFDQARDLFESTKILSGDIKIIGPTAGNNPNLHHGVAWLYYMLPALVFSQNPMSVVVWNSLFNAGTVIVIYFLAKSLFKSKTVGYIAATIIAASYYFTQFSSWLSNPTATLLTVPLFFFGMWAYYKEKSWGLPLAAILLGLSIQFELFFIYLIPVGILLWIILKPKLLNLKLFLLSFLSLALTLSTMILTEMKFGFAGVKSIISAGNYVGGGVKNSFWELSIKFLSTRWEDFYLNFWPQNEKIGIYLGLLVVGFFIFEIIKNRKEKEIVKRNLFLLIWLFSPMVMLILGTHNAPWFLIGRPTAAIIMTAYLISKLRLKFFIGIVVMLIIFTNLSAIKNDYGKSKLLDPDLSASLSKQIAAMEYSYQKSAGEKFAIDTVTNPLYINAVWAWNYNWYSNKYGFKPTFLGGDQVPPYNTLEKASGNEKYLFLIIDQTYRIPPVYKENAINSMKKKAKLVEEKDFQGITVQMWIKNLEKTGNGLKGEKSEK